MVHQRTHTGRSLINVKIVRKPFVIAHNSPCTKEFILERNPMNVLSVAKPLVSVLLSITTSELTLERSTQVWLGLFVKTRFSKTARNFRLRFLYKYVHPDLYLEPPVPCVPSQDFPRGPVVKALSSQNGGMSFDSWFGNDDSTCHTAWLT